MRRVPGYRFIVLSAVGLLGCAGARPGERTAQTSQAADLFGVYADSLWLPDSIETPPGPTSDDQAPNVLHLKNGHRLVVNLYNIHVFGTLPRADQAPLLMLGATSCWACDVARAVYFVPSDADSIGGDIRPYIFPGTLRPSASESEDTTPTFRARVFLGKCLDPALQEAVWFESERDSTDRWLAKVFHVVVSGDSELGEYLSPRPAIDSVLDQVKGGACRELPGLDQVRD